MSGRDGARGYLYQAIHAAIASLSNSDWLYVEIEPNTNEEKVDIIWYFEYENIKATQVKSSKIQFSKSQIKKWSKQVFEDMPRAKEIELALIGTCDNATKIFINQINSNTLKLEDRNKIGLNEDQLAKLNIEIQAFQLETLETKVLNSLQKFFSSQKIDVKFEDAQNMSYAIIYQFSVFATNGSKISKIDFEKRLIKWARDNNPKAFNSYNKTNLTVEFYLRSKQQFSNTIEQQKINIFEETSLSSTKNKLVKKVQEINQIIIIPEIIKKENSFYSNTLASPFNTENMNGITKVVISPEKKQIISSVAWSLLGIKIQDDFFEIGNLKKHTSKNYFNGTSTIEYLGSERSKLKMQEIKSFEKELFLLKSRNEQNAFMNQFSLIPLVLKNQGQEADFKIRVQLKFSRQLKLLYPNNYLKPDYNILSEFLDNDGILNRKFRHIADSRVQQKPMELSFEDSEYSIYKRLLSYEEKKKDNYQRFYQDLNNLFDFNVFEENEFNILEFTFDRLNPKEVLSFPCYLFIQSRNEFSIQFNITSEKSTNMIEGILKYKT